MSFKFLTDNQILAIAIDEWLMGLDDKDWEEALLHIEMRKKQRANQKKAHSDSQEFRSKPRNTSVTPQNIRNPL